MSRTLRLLGASALVLGPLAGGAWGAASAHAQDEDTWLDMGSGTTSHARLPFQRGGVQDPPATYEVHRGDTLWDISGHFFGDPYAWPRVWSFNPEITNPHWIYPQQSVRLRGEGQGAVIVPSSTRSVGRARGAVEPGTVFLREQGWLDAEALETAGLIVGSPDDHMLLSPFDQAYVRFDRLPEGQSEPSGEYTIFRRIEARDRTAGEEGVLVRILGTVRVTGWDADRHTARVTLFEALEPIERGFEVAALPRRFEVVPPVRAEQNLEGRVVAVLTPLELVGDQQIVFVGLGEDDGLRLGNRSFVVRAGDDWRRELAPAQRDATTVAPPPEPEQYPDEVVAEARVVSLRPHSAGLLVTRAARPVVLGDRVQLMQGY